MKKALVMAFLCCMTAAWAQNSKTDIQDQTKTKDMKKADNSLDGRSYKITLKRAANAGDQTGTSGNVQDQNMSERKKTTDMSKNSTTDNTSVIEQKTETENNTSVIGNDQMSDAQNRSSQMYSENQVMVISFNDGMLVTDANRNMTGQSGQMNRSGQSASYQSGQSKTYESGQTGQMNQPSGKTDSYQSGQTDQMNQTGQSSTYQSGQTSTSGQTGTYQSGQTNQSGRTAVETYSGQTDQNQMHQSGQTGQNTTGQMNQTGQPDQTGNATMDYRTNEATAASCPYTITSGSGELSTFSASCPSSAEGMGRSTWSGFINEGSISGSLIVYDSNGMSTRYSFTGKSVKKNFDRKSTSSR